MSVAYLSTILTENGREIEDYQSFKTQHNAECNVRNSIRMHCGVVRAHAASALTAIPDIPPKRV